MNRIARPSRASARSVLEQRRHPLRRQHRGRLVHDQELRVLQQRPDDLDALALADRQAVHRRTRLERQPEALPGLAHAPRELLERARHRERDVLDDGERLEQREVLEHHADAELARPRRARHAHRRPAPQDLAGVGPRGAVHELRQRRLARPVLAEQRVDLAGAHRQVHGVVGERAGVGLRDPAQLEQRGVARARRLVARARRPGPALHEANVPGIGTKPGSRPTRSHQRRTAGTRSRMTPPSSESITWG